MMRIFQIAIIIFWLGSVGWLVKTIVTPDEAGMVEVDLRRPVKSFFEWNDTSRMLLLQNGRKLGEMQVVGFSADDDDEESPAGFSLAVMLNGDVDASLVGTFTRTLLRFNRDFTFRGGDLLFRMPYTNIKVLASSNIKEERDVSKIEVSLAGNQIFAYDSETDDSLNTSLLSSLNGASMVNDMIAKAGTPDNWKWKLEAFRGMHSFEGKRLPVYLLKLSMDQTEQTVRLYLSESGEPLQINTDLGFKAVSEVLAPIDRKPLEREAIFPQSTDQ